MAELLLPTPTHPPLFSKTHWGCVAIAMFEMTASEVAAMRRAELPDMLRDACVGCEWVTITLCREDVLVLADDLDRVLADDACSEA